MGNTKSTISSSVFFKKKKRKEKKKRGKTKKKMSQGKYSKITQPSLFYIRVCNNHGIQKPQLWSNDKDQCIKISFSFSLEIISPLSAADAHELSTCEEWGAEVLQPMPAVVGILHGRQRCSATAWCWSALGRGPPSSHKPSLSPVKSFLTFISVAPWNMHEKNDFLLSIH